MVLVQLLNSANEAAAALTASATFFKRDNVCNNSTSESHTLSPALTGVFGALVPILVLLSGLFAGLTLGYMSLDETQLNVLAISGTEQQKKCAKKIIPIRKNGHLLLITLILANMIANETLPVIADKVFNGGIQAVVASTALIVIFSEIIPQTICTRYGLVIGAKMAVFVRVLIVIFSPIAWPVSKLLEIILGPHHGIIYRRSELKELIAMHADDHPATQGGELRHDTAAIIGHTLDLQEKVVKEAMTSIENVFMLSIEEKLDYATLTRIHKTGHSRIPVYTEVDSGKKGEKFRKILGILLVKQCVLLDPEDATPLRTIPLNKVPPIAYDEPLLKVLDRFQEGRSHMAIVSKYSSKRAASVKEAVKPALTRRFLNRFRDSDSSDEGEDLEKGADKKGSNKEKKPIQGSGKPLEQSMPADALLPKANAEKFLQGLDQYTNPMGIITLEDVLEELIGEEIYDEFDLKGAHALAASTYVPPEAAEAVAAVIHPPMVPLAPSVEAPVPPVSRSALGALKVPMPKMNVPQVFGGFGMGMMRTRSAPGTPRGGVHALPAEAPPPVTEEPAGLGLIKEVGTPSTLGRRSLPPDSEAEKSKEDEGETTAASAAATSGEVTPIAPTEVGRSDRDRARSSSTPPSPHPQAQVAPILLLPAPGRTNSPAPSQLTEAVLRGRQARASTVSTDGTTTPGGARSTVKGRFKSTPLALDTVLSSPPAGGGGKPVSNDFYAPPQKSAGTGEKDEKEKDQTGGQ